MVGRNYFSVTELNQSSNLIKAIYSNKSKLFNSIQNCMEKYNFTHSEFVNVFDYDNDKKVNYNNITQLLRILLINESFVVKLYNETDEILLEITKLQMNQEILLYKK